MERGYHKMARFGGVQGQSDRFRIAQFTHHYHIRIFPQDIYDPCLKECI